MNTQGVRIWSVAILQIWFTYEVLRNYPVLSYTHAFHLRPRPASRCAAGRSSVWIHLQYILSVIPRAVLMLVNISPKCRTASTYHNVGAPTAVSSSAGVDSPFTKTFWSAMSIMFTRGTGRLSVFSTCEMPCNPYADSGCTQLPVNLYRDTHWQLHTET